MRRAPLNLWPKLRSLLAPPPRPGMGLVLGAESFRCVLFGKHEVVSEPAFAWRRREDGRVLLDGRSIGRMAEATLICRNVDAYERVRPFDSSLPVNGHLLKCIFRYYRKEAAERWKCREPGRVVVTGRPAALRAIEDVAQRAARNAGLRECRAVPEAQCLARGAGLDPSAPALLVDVGFTGVRVYGWRDGRVAGEPAEEVPAGGEEMLQTILRFMRAAHSMDIGLRTAEHILVALGGAGGWPLDVRGRHQVSGRPCKELLDRQEAAFVIQPFFEEIATAASARIIELGLLGASGLRVVLAGAAANSEDLLLLMEQRLGARVELRPEPGDISARGLAAFLQDAT